MAAVAPRVLESLSALMGRSLVRRSVGALFQRLARTRLPVVSVDRYAMDAPDHEGLHFSDDPLVIRFAPAREGSLPQGPLAGEAVVVKDSIDVAGARTGLGLRAGGEIAARDALIVRRIREAGGFLAGKAKMTELGMDGLGAIIHEEMPANPRAPRYFPGGSSTGTAVALASGIARYGVGGDGMGSIRIPAAFCGLVGLKPTRDRLPTEGYPSVAPTMDVPGPMARTAADCARFWQVIAGEPVTPIAPRAPARVGVIRQLGPELASRSVRVAFHRTIARLGARIEDADVPGAEHNALLGMAIGTHEVARFALAAGERAAAELSAAGKLTVAIGQAIDRDAADALTRLRDALRDATLRAIDRTGVLAMPTTAIPAPAITRALFAGAQDGLLLRALGAYTPLANCTGLPSIAVPNGVDDRGRPLSIMLVGPPGSEEELLAIALAIEETGVASLPV